MQLEVALALLLFDMQDDLVSTSEFELDCWAESPWHDGVIGGSSEEPHDNKDNGSLSHHSSDELESQHSSYTDCDSDDTHEVKTKASVAKTVITDKDFEPIKRVTRSSIAKSNESSTSVSSQSRKSTDWNMLTDEYKEIFSDDGDSGDEIVMRGSGKKRKSLNTTTTKRKGSKTTAARAVNRRGNKVTEQNLAEEWYLYVAYVLYCMLCYV